MNAYGEDVEEEFSTGFRQWYEAEFVDDQELHFVEGFLKAQKMFLVTCLDKFVDQGGGWFP